MLDGDPAPPKEMVQVGLHRAVSTMCFKMCLCGYIGLLVSQSRRNRTDVDSFPRESAVTDAELHRKQQFHLRSPIGRDQRIRRKRRRPHNETPNRSRGQSFYRTRRRCEVVYIAQCVCGLASPGGLCCCNAPRRHAADTI